MIVVLQIKDVMEVYLKMHLNMYKKMQLPQNNHILIKEHKTKNANNFKKLFKYLIILMLLQKKNKSSFRHYINNLYLFILMQVQLSFNSTEVESLIMMTVVMI